MDSHTWASRGAVAVTGLLAAIELYTAGLRPGAGTVVEAGQPLGAVLGSLILLATVALARASCFETRLAVVLVCGAELGLTALALVTGLPGGSRHPLDVESATAVLLSVTAPALLALDRRTRRSRSLCDANPRTYAL